MKMLSDENKISAFIFDMDGILLDTESVCRICWQRAALEMGLTGGDEIYQKCIGCNTSDMNVMINDFFSCQTKKFDVLEFNKRAYELFYEVEKEQGLKKMPGTDECLKSLTEKGYILAVASSTKTKTVKRQLKDAGIDHYFKTFTCGDTVTHSKPNPEIYLKACRSLNLLPQNCVAIEDSPNGVRSATSAGMRCIMIPDQIQPTEEIRSLAWKIFPSLVDISRFAL